MMSDKQMKDTMDKLQVLIDSYQHLSIPVLNLTDLNNIVDHITELRNTVTTAECKIEKQADQIKHLMECINNQAMMIDRFKMDSGRSVGIIGTKKTKYSYADYYSEDYNS